MQVQQVEQATRVSYGCCLKVVVFFKSTCKRREESSSGQEMNSRPNSWKIKCSSLLPAMIKCSFLSEAV